MNMAMVVGDIVSYSTIAESTGGRVLLENIDRLYAGLRQILTRHQGTLSNYVGDAFFATWEVAAVPDAARAATAFAIEAAERMPQIAAGLDLRDPGGGPLRMGWGVASGPAAVSLLTGMLVTVVGDATNVAFRLSGLAGRDGRPDVLVTDAVHRTTSASFAFTASSAVQVKGRRQAVEILGASRKMLLRPHVRDGLQDLDGGGAAVRQRVGGPLAHLLAHDRGAQRGTRGVDVDRRPALFAGGEQERHLVLVLDEPDGHRHARADHPVGARRAADPGVLEDVLERDDPRLDLALLVLGRVITAVLTQIPLLAGRLDLLRDIDAAPS
jgi:class 3 adenylate cyclase